MKVKALYNQYLKKYSSFYFLMKIFFLIRIEKLHVKHVDPLNPVLHMQTPSLVQVPPFEQARQPPALHPIPYS